MHAQKLDARPHARVVDTQADDRQHHEDDELAATGHAFFMGEHVAHRRDVIEHHRHRERDGGADQVVHAERLGKQGQQAVVDDERDHADHAELHKLRDKLLHAGLLSIASGGIPHPPAFEQGPARYIHKYRRARRVAGLNTGAWHRQQAERPVRKVKTLSAQPDDYGTPCPIGTTIPRHPRIYCGKRGIHVAKPRGFE